VFARLSIDVLPDVRAMRCAQALVATTIRLRVERRSTASNSTALRPFDDLHYGSRSTCVRAAALRTDEINKL